MKQIAINQIIIGGGKVSATVIAGLAKSGILNTLPLNPINQHYTAFLVIDEADTDK